MKNQEKDLKNENTGSTRRKLTKEELTALCRRMEKHGQRFREYMRMVEEERERAEQEKNQIHQLEKKQQEKKRQKTLWKVMM